MQQFVPIGYWERGDVTNIGLDRWAADFTGAVTYLDMKTGVELSGAASFTFNGENNDTNYKPWKAPRCSISQIRLPWAFRAISTTR
jgi:hypothetical protein